MKTRNKKWATATMFVLVTLSTLCGTLFAQGTGMVLGLVHDPTGAVIPNATVTVKNVQTGIERKLQTNANGYYTADLLPVGEFQIEGEGRGFLRVLGRG